MTSIEEVTRITGTDLTPEEYERAAYPIPVIEIGAVAIVMILALLYLLG